MLKPKLTFDQLVGHGIKYSENQSSVRNNSRISYSSAFCRDHEMRAGRHFAVFSDSSFERGRIDFGIVRPIQINQSDFADGELRMFHPAMFQCREYLRGKRTGRWSDSTVHCCAMNTTGPFSDMTGQTMHKAYGLTVTVFKAELQLVFCLI